MCATCWFVRPQRVKCTPRYLTSFDAKMLYPFTLIVHLRVLRGVGVEWDEHSFLGRESESIYLDKVDHPVHSFLEQFHAVFHPRAVCVETSEVGVRPYRLVVGVHGQHYLSFHCRDRLGGLFQHPIRDGVHTGGDFDFLDGSQGSS